MSRTVRVGLGDRAYDVVVGGDLLGRAGVLLAPFAATVQSVGPSSITLVIRTAYSELPPPTINAANAMSPR